MLEICQIWHSTEITFYFAYCRSNIFKDIYDTSTWKSALGKAESRYYFLLTGRTSRILVWIKQKHTLK